MNTTIKKILSLCILLFAAALINSCGAKRQPSVVVEKQPQKKQPQKQSKRLTIQREKRAFSELDSETDESPTLARQTSGSNSPEKATPTESESSSLSPPAQSNAPTSLKPLTSQEEAEGWVDATGECYQDLNMTREEATQHALKQAERNAIAKKCGIAVSAQTLQLQSETQQDFHESFIQLSLSAVYGRIVEKKEPLWAPVENVQFSPGEPPIPLYCVTLRAKVAKEKGKPDPSFQVTLKLNDDKLTFREGEEMILHISPTKDCYITVFNVLSDGTVLILFPPQGHTQQVARARQKLSLPSEAERRQGVHFRVGLMPGKTQDTEYVWVVATKDDIPFLPRETKEFSIDLPILSGKVVLPTYQSALEEISRWLVSIPLDKRYIAMEQYHIRKK